VEVEEVVVVVMGEEEDGEGVATMMEPRTERAPARGLGECVGERAWEVDMVMGEGDRALGCGMLEVAKRREEAERRDDSAGSVRVGVRSLLTTMEAAYLYR
jgi:hypothetical protein